MVSKETLIAWLNSHGHLTADLEFDIHDCFDVALDAAQAALEAMPGIGFLSPKRRLESFYSVCRYLDGRVGRGGLEEGEALVALAILRAMDPDFRKAISEFDTRADTLPAGTLSAIPLIAREYLAASRERYTPLVAG